MSKDTQVGAVESPSRGLFTTLARVTLKTLSHALWIGLTALAAVVVVLLSWSVPEPESPDTPAERVENISYTQCVARAESPPSYGARWLRSCNR